MENRWNTKLNSENSILSTRRRCGLIGSSEPEEPRATGPGRAGLHPRLLSLRWNHSGLVSKQLQERVVGLGCCLKVILRSFVGLFFLVFGRIC